MVDHDPSPNRWKINIKSSGIPASSVSDPDNLCNSLAFSFQHRFYTPRKEVAVTAMKGLGFAYFCRHHHELNQLLWTIRENSEYFEFGSGSNTHRSCLACKKKVPNTTIPQDLLNSAVLTGNAFGLEAKPRQMQARSSAYQLFAEYLSCSSWPKCMRRDKFDNQ